MNSRFQEAAWREETESTSELELVSKSLEKKGGDEAILPGDGGRRQAGEKREEIKELGIREEGSGVRSKPLNLTGVKGIYSD